MPWIGSTPKAAKQRFRGSTLNPQWLIHSLDHLVFDKAFDAAKVLDLSIKGERQVIDGMINLQFVQNVLSVLVDEINDEDVLRRIAGRLKSLIQTEETSKI